MEKDTVELQHTSVDSLVVDMPDFITEDPTYEVWIFGYDSDGRITDYEVLVDTFDDMDTAITAASNLKYNKNFLNNLNIPTNVHTTAVEVELVVEYDDGNTENIDTVYGEILDI